jgi:hypothetical protein
MHQENLATPDEGGNGIETKFRMYQKESLDTVNVDKRQMFFFACKEFSCRSYFPDDGSFSVR